ncbi:MAG TPA: hypothetical protein VFX49_10945, partial [Chloroflexota bacterium]|nr:hypothetical protein [Chloroflexota bacterium]
MVATRMARSRRLGSGWVRRRGALAAALGSGLTACAVPGLDRFSAPRERLAERQVLRLALATDPQTIDPARASYVDEIAV